MTSIDKPPRPGRSHVYAVVRLDFRGQFLRVPRDYEDHPGGIAGTTAYRTAEEAEAEAQRLNELQSDKHCRYFVMLLRMVESEGPAPSE